MCLCLSPPLNPRLHSAHLVRLKGVSRGDLEAGRGAAPAGSCTRHEHSGGSGAPPGPNTRSRREPADRAYGGVRPDRKPEARPGAGDAAMARREALACRKARNHLRTASFGAPSPFSCPKGGEKQSPDAEHASRQRRVTSLPLARGRAWHYFPSMQRPKAQMLEKTGAILRLPAASARALGALKRLVLRRP